MIKRIICLVYNLYLRFRLNLSSAGARIVADSFRNDYKVKLCSAVKTFLIHRKGFAVSDWCLMGVTEENYKEYLSNVDYARMHPINGRYTAWIDDKLTLKYICSGTELDRYMPEYYYQIDDKGNIMSLMDLPEFKERSTAEDVAELLRDKGTLAIKLIAGSIGAGFYKGEYKNDTYYLNGQAMELGEFCEKISALREYIIIEYLRPHQQLAEYCPDTVNCIRYLMGRIDGKMEMLKGYIRLGTKRSGFVENYNAGGVLCYLDKCGHFEYGNVMSSDCKHNVVINTHPDTKAALSGSVPMWDDVLSACDAFDKYFPQMNYMGMDFVITDDNRVKVLEINSLTSLDGFQLDEAIWKNSAGRFYRQHMR